MDTVENLRDKEYLLDFVLLENLDKIKCVEYEDWFLKISRGYIGFQSGNLELAYIQERDTNHVHRIRRSGWVNSSSEIEELKKLIPPLATFEYRRRYYIVDRQYIDQAKQGFLKKVSELHPIKSIKKIIASFTEEKEFDESLV